MALFEKSKQSGVFRSEAALLPEFMPDKPLHREAQLHEVADCISPALEGKRSENVFLHGLPGTGKTTTMQYILGELRDYDQRVKTLYVNCWRYNTRLAIISLLADKFEITMPRRGIAGDEILHRIIEIAKKQNSGIIIALDEIDQLIARGEAGILYDLSRASEVYGIKVGILSASNYSTALSGLDNRIKSSFSPRSIEFPRYSPLELKDILRERAKQAFQLGSYSEETIALAAGHAAKNGGDARLALKLLWSAAKLAEEKGEEAITLQAMREVLDRKPPGIEKIEQAKRELSEVQRKILKLVERGEKTSGEIYAELAKEGIEERTARNHLTALEKMHVVNARDVIGESGKGKTRVITLNK